ncbi:MAG: 16S rRNA (guanine(527)-N(7))-methyltransferase RsmG [Deltaproteobacteria bacterium]|nr:16S rRNA (guanine(527)-N(7))-methyltransferase RsmG [Deltaproteobacteria bacterium]MBW1795599.1 16S rRNA (guanine(527)-N(7))-methyltransferase RsmG [Deltaproteobacteria bacterium]MBW2329937.1 16S rRNA (guanine(527)-N(7))-methyltransferase RsmG [Deltaproteobacteria bacterium]
MPKNQTDIEYERPVRIPIQDVLDLHTFAPKEIPSLLKEYLNACLRAKIYSVRIIHGKGKGFLRNRVHGLLKDLPVVASFSEAPPRGGGWGATIVELRRKVDFESSEWAHILDEGARAMGMRLDLSQIAQFAIHARELLAWNRFTNLTAITDPVEIAVKQFLDTLPLSRLLPLGSRVLDIGSGGGFPGIPLKIMRPDLEVTLIDASRKKVSFQKHIIRTLALKDIEARHIRAEELKGELQPEIRQYDVIVSKAVSKLDRFLDQAIPLLRRPGVMIAMKGRSVEAELEAVSSKIEAEGLTLTVKKYRLPHLDIERSLIILSNSPDALNACQSLA